MAVVLYTNAVKGKLKSVLCLLRNVPRTHAGVDPAAGGGDHDGEAMMLQPPPTIWLKHFIFMLMTLLCVLLATAGGCVLWRIHRTTHSASAAHDPFCVGAYALSNSRASAILRRRPDAFEFSTLVAFKDANGTQLGTRNGSAGGLKDAHVARVLHDLVVEQTAIIDAQLRRCYVMPLDRDSCEPAHNVPDIIEKLRGGYYLVDTQQLPRDPFAPRNSFGRISERITSQCLEMAIYHKDENTPMLAHYQPIATNVSSGKYLAFYGKDSAEVNVMNIASYDHFVANRRSHLF